MYPGVVKSGLSLTKVIGGVSKTLSVANQLIPLYVQVKPMISNAKSAFGVAKEILSTPNNTKTSSGKKGNVLETKKRSVSNVTPQIKNTNNPVFFL